MPTRLEIVKADCRVIAADTAAIEALKGQTILVTGGTGFLGTWVAEMVAYLNDQHGFGMKICLLATGTADFAARQPHLAGRKDVELIQADVANVVELPDDVTHIIHAAASPDSRQHTSDPLHVIRTVVRGTQAVLDAASRLPRLKRVVNLSSGLIYGPRPPEGAPVAENQFGGFDPASIANTYAEAKRMAEQICSVYRSQHRMPVLNVRPFSFVGPYQRLDRPWALNNFIRDALQGVAIRIHGDGQTVRGYMYGGDAAWWLLNILVRGEIGTSYNLGGDKPVSLSELADMVACMLPNRPAVTTGLFGQGVPRSSFVPDTTLARGLGLTQRVGLDEAIRRTLDWNRAS